jgi:hypothetical protein
MTNSAETPSSLLERPRPMLGDTIVGDGIVRRADDDHRREVIRGVPVSEAVAKTAAI